ncbi:hypothetical protein ACLMJK_005756 [Lecanora helva]
MRLSKHYLSFKLVEVDAQSLFSKYFSESGKAVSKVFDKVESMLVADENTFICIFIDEIESLASSRQHSVNSNEPQDSLRAVNALLVGLDRIRNRPNVVVICTSNLIKALDPAFLDRVDKKQYVPLPNAEARYEILRIRCLELAKCGILAPIKDPMCSDSGSLSVPEDGSSPSRSNGHHPQFRPLTPDVLPPYNRMMLRYFPDETSWPRKLWNIAEKNENLSGRTLHRLPILSLAMYARQDPCPMDEALDALSRAVDEEMNAAKETGVGDEEGQSGAKRQRMMMA